jgi:hypothetical protein
MSTPIPPNPPANQRYWSPSTRGFYSSHVHGNAVPADAVKISDQTYARLISANSAGSDIELGSQGMPIAVERTPDQATKIASARARRNAALVATDWMMLRHQEEDARSKTLSDDAVAALTRYRAELRAWPQQPGFPDVPMPKASNTDG